MDGSELRAGARVVGRAETGREAVEGVAIPREAVVRFAGKTWAYVARGSDEDEFERREVAIDAPVAGGWLNGEGWKPGERVVVSGAQLLLSEERRVRAAGPDED
jgi:multidrug efflux pump subunit AcrA (membrane-fusion protein)